MLSTSQLQKKIAHFFHRYHIVLFVIFVFGSSAIAILALQHTIAVSEQDNGYTSSANSTSFDADTIEKLRGLKTSNQTTDKLDFSNGRTNPF